MHLVGISVTTIIKFLSLKLFRKVHPLECTIKTGIFMGIQGAYFRVNIYTIGTLFLFLNIQKFKEFV